MSKTAVKTSRATSPSKGGTITRDAQTGRFVSVQTCNGVSKAKPKTISVVKDVSNRRTDALNRLKDR